MVYRFSACRSNVGSPHDPNGFKNSVLTPLRYFAITRISRLHIWESIGDWLHENIRFGKTDPSTTPRRQYVCGGMRQPTFPENYDTTQRVIVEEKEIIIFGWPSRGGVIVLEHADAVDFDFVGLDRVNHPEKRHDDQGEEDLFCQRLLLVGAKWFSSRRRYHFLKAANDPYDDLNYKATSAIDKGSEPAPTSHEGRWFSVGLPSTGGLWISEYITYLGSNWGEEGKENGEREEEESEDDDPPETSRLSLARTMDEKCQILKQHFKGKFYNDRGDYKGHALINGWNTHQVDEEKNPKYRGKGDFVVRIGTKL